MLGGQFSASVPLAAGDNAVEVVARDLAGNVTRKSLHLSVSALPPTVTILAPAESSESPTPVVHVRAQVTSTAPLASVSIGTGTAAGSIGVYEADVPLALGENTISVVALDSSGLTGRASVQCT